MLEATVTPGIQFVEGDKVDTGDLNLLGRPTVTIQGTVAGMEPNTLAPTMTALEGDDIPDAAADTLKTDGTVPIASLVTVYPQIDVRAFGAIGDGTYHAVQEWVDDGLYEDLSAIQADYPWVIALTDSIDWAAIQKALDVAWQRIRSSHSPEDISVATCPAVFLGNGWYKTNRSLIVPPRCSLRGNGWHSSFVYYVPDSGAIPDAKWSNIASGEDWLPPEAGLNAAVVIRYRCDTTRTHITDSFVRGIHLGDPMDPPISVGHTATETAYGTKVSGLAINTYASNCVGLLAHSLNLNTVEDVHFNGYGGTNNWGVVVSMDSQGACATGVVFRHCYFENLVAAIHCDIAQQIVVEGHIVDQIGHMLFAFQCFDSQITGNNACNRQSNYTGGRHGIDIAAGNNVAITGNTFGGFERAIDIAGAAFSVTGNAVMTTGEQPTPASGYAIRIRAKSAKFPGSVLSIYNLTNWNVGYNLSGNTVAHEGSAPNLATVKPFLIEAVPGETIEVNASANGYAAGFGSYGDQCETRGPVSLRCYERQFCRQAGPPNQLPDHLGQIWSDASASPDRLYVATRIPDAIASGNIVAGVRYWVGTKPVTYADGAWTAAGTIAYNGATYTAGQSFVGVSDVTTFTATNNALYPDLSHAWRPLGEPRAERITTLATVTTAERVLSIDDAALELVDVVKVAFNNLDSDGTITLPLPSLCAGRKFRLLATKAGTTGSRAIQLASAWDPADTEAPYTRLVNLIETGLGYGTAAYPTGKPIATTYLTSNDSAAKSILVELCCDGTYWYVRR
jgi:hypothetical protein